MNKMNTKTIAIVGVLVGMSLVTTAVMAQQAEAGKPQPEFKGPVKVFILAGQSNMEGHGGVKTLDRLGEHPTHGYLLKKIKRDDGSFVVRDDVFVSYQKADETIKRPLSVGMGAWGADWFGPELMFGIEMGDHFQEPILLIKTCWGGHSLYGNFRPPSAGKAAYETGYKPEEIGASYHKMVKEVRECLANLDTDFPQLKGLKTEICGFVWFQGWNDMCQPGDDIRQQVYDEYCPTFVHLVQDLRAEFKVPNLPVVMGELGVGGESVDRNMMDFRAGQAKIATCPELKGTLGYVRTAPFWYPELDDLPRKMESEEHRVRNTVADQLKVQLKDTPESADPKKMEQLVKEAGDKALEQDAAYQKAKKDADGHVSNWYCHYQGSARVYCMVGYSLAEAMKPLLTLIPISRTRSTPWTRKHWNCWPQKSAPCTLLAEPNPTRSLLPWTTEWVEAARVAHAMEHNRMGVMGHYYCGMPDIYSDLTQQCAGFGGHVENFESWNVHGPAHHCAVGVSHIGGKLEKLGRLLQMEVVKVCMARLDLPPSPPKH